MPERKRGLAIAGGELLVLGLILIALGINFKDAATLIPGMIMAPTSLGIMMIGLEW